MDALVLWDIDGTLLNSHGVGRSVFARAVEEATGETDLPPIVMSGKTDPQIAREWLALLDLSDSEPLLEAILRNLEEHMVQAKAELERVATVPPGVRDLLRLLAGRNFSQTVCTGNIMPNAVVKMRSVGLEQVVDMSVGAYGSDHADRRMLVPFALERVRTRLAKNVAAKDTWVIGDTPNDLACARAAEAKCLLVCTGSYKHSDLANLGADAVFEDLSDTEAVLSVLER